MTDENEVAIWDNAIPSLTDGFSRISDENISEKNTLEEKGHKTQEIDGARYDGNTPLKAVVPPMPITFHSKEVSNLKKDKEKLGKDLQDSKETNDKLKLHNTKLQYENTLLRLELQKRIRVQNTLVKKYNDIMDKDRINKACFIENAEHKSLALTSKMQSKALSEKVPEKLDKVDENDESGSDKGTLGKAVKRKRRQEDLESKMSGEHCINDTPDSITVKRSKKSDKNQEASNKSVPQVTKTSTVQTTNISSEEVS